MSTNDEEVSPTSGRSASWSMPESLLSQAWAGSNAQQAQVWDQLIQIIQAPNASQPEKVQRVQNGIANTVKLAPDAIQCVAPSVTADGTQRRPLTVRLVKETTISALQTLHERYPADRLAMLNNANDQTPGGYFLQGSTAQEESLCLYTNLLLSLNNVTYPIAPPSLVYSPDVLVMKRDVGTWNGPQLDPADEFWTDVISAAAISNPATIVDPNDPTGYKRTWANSAQAATMQTAITKIVEAARMNGVQRLVLGAWGCGAFRNPIHAVAAQFREVLIGAQDAESLPAFDWAGMGLEEVVFAVYDNDKKSGFPVYGAFAEEFEKTDDLPEGMDRVATEEVCYHLFWPVAPAAPNPAASFGS